MENRDVTPRKITPDKIKSTLMVTKSRAENRITEGAGLRSPRSRSGVPEALHLGRERRIRKREGNAQNHDVCEDD